MAQDSAALDGLLRRPAGEALDPPLVPIRLTRLSTDTYTDGSKRYDWTRRSWDAKAGRADDQFGETGTANDRPAIAPNGEVYTVPSDAWARPVVLMTEDPTGSSATPPASGPALEILSLTATGAGEKVARIGDPAPLGAGFLFQADVYTIDPTSLTQTATGEHVYVYVLNVGANAKHRWVTLDTPIGTATDGTTIYPTGRYFYPGGAAGATDSNTTPVSGAAFSWQALTGATLTFGGLGDPELLKGTYLVACQVSGSIIVSASTLTNNTLLARLASSGGVTLFGGSTAIVASATNQPPTLNLWRDAGSATLVAAAVVTDPGTALVWAEVSRTSTTGLGLVGTTPLQDSSVPVQFASVRIG